MRRGATRVRVARRRGGEKRRGARAVPRRGETAQPRDGDGVEAMAGTSAGVNDATRPTVRTIGERFYRAPDIVSWPAWLESGTTVPRGVAPLSAETHSRARAIWPLRSRSARRFRALAALCTSAAPVRARVRARALPARAPPRAAMMPPVSDDEPASALRRRLVDALSRGRPGTTPPRVSREHSLPPERRADGIVVQRVMLAPEPGDGREHAVPVVLVHRRCDEEDRSRPRPVVAFLHGTGGDTEGLLDAHLVPLAERGYVAVGVDAPCHGRRLDPEKPARRPDPAEKTTTSAARRRRRRRRPPRAVRPRAERSSGTAPPSSPRAAARPTRPTRPIPNVARTSPERQSPTPAGTRARRGRFSSTARGTSSGRFVSSDGGAPRLRLRTTLLATPPKTIVLAAPKTTTNSAFGFLRRTPVGSR